MNKCQQLHLERKEYWKETIAKCEASGMAQQDWCRQNNVCSASLSRWRTQIWREDEAPKEFAARKEEHCFVEVRTMPENEDEPMLPVIRESKTVRKGTRRQSEGNDVQTAYSMKPDVVIGYRDCTIGVYEHTSSQLLQKVMEVLRYA